MHVSEILLVFDILFDSVPTVVAHWFGDPASDVRINMVSSCVDILL